MYNSLLLNCDRSDEGVMGVCLAKVSCEENSSGKGAGAVTHLNKRENPMVGFH